MQAPAKTKPRPPMQHAMPSKMDRSYKGNIMEHKGYKSVNYNGLNALTIEAIKELRAQNEALKAEVEQLKKSLN